MLRVKQGSCEYQFKSQWFDPTRNQTRVYSSRGGRCIFAGAKPLTLNTSLSASGFGVRLPSRSNRTRCRQQLAPSAMFLQSCVAQTLSRRNGPRHSLRASAWCHEYGEGLIFLTYY